LYFLYTDIGNTVYSQTQPVFAVITSLFGVTASSPSSGGSSLSSGIRFSVLGTNEKGPPAGDPFQNLGLGWPVPVTGRRLKRRPRARSPRGDILAFVKTDKGGGWHGCGKSLEKTSGHDTWGAGLRQQCLRHSCVWPPFTGQPGNGARGHLPSGDRGDARGRALSFPLPSA
jgi:hypothetical protein